jgi:hypothetical protein
LRWVDTFVFVSPRALVGTLLGLVDGGAAAATLLVGALLGLVDDGAVAATLLVELDVAAALHRVDLTDQFRPEFTGKVNVLNLLKMRLFGVNTAKYFVDYNRIHFCLEPILRLLNLKLQRQRCSRLDRFQK